MNYTTEKTSNSEIKVNFTADASEFESAIEKAYQKIKHKFNISGFRKGKAPRRIIEGIYGKEVFFEDALDIIIPDGYDLLVEKEKDMQIVCRPELDSFDFKNDGSVTFTLKVTVRPEVKLGKYKGLNIAKKAVKVTKAQVEEEINRQRERLARLVETDDAAQLKDIVTIDFVGSCDGEKFEGGTAENFELELGTGMFVPGFEEQLVGVKAGEERTVTVRFPEDYYAENLKGKEATFECKVHSVKRKDLPKLDDEFVKDVSEFDTVDEYKKNIENRLKEEQKAQNEREFENAVIEKIVNASEVDIPKAMIDEEVESMVREFEYRLSFQRLKLDDYLKYMNMTLDALKKDYEEPAKNAIKTRLVMEDIVKAENISYTNDEFQAELEKLAAQNSKDGKDGKLNLRRDQVEYMANKLLSDKLLEFLKKENEKKDAKKSTEAAESSEEKAE